MWENPISPVICSSPYPCLLFVSPSPSFATSGVIYELRTCSSRATPFPSSAEKFVGTSPMVPPCGAPWHTSGRGCLPIVPSKRFSILSAKIGIVPLSDCLHGEGDKAVPLHILMCGETHHRKMSSHGLLVCWIIVCAPCDLDLVQPWPPF